MWVEREKQSVLRIYAGAGSARSHAGARSAACSACRAGLVGIAMPCVRAPIIGIKTCEAKQLEQRFALAQHLGLAPATDKANTLPVW